jgi:hypothetical protein
MPFGEQEVTFHVQAIGLGDRDLSSEIMFDVAQDMVRIASIELIGAEGSNILRSGKVKLRFFNGAPKALFEFRIRTLGRPYEGTLNFYGATLRCLGQ